MCTHSSRCGSDACVRRAVRARRRGPADGCRAPCRLRVGRRPPDRMWSPRGTCWCVAAAPTGHRGNRSARRRRPWRAGAAIGITAPASLRRTSRRRRAPGGSGGPRRTSAGRGCCGYGPCCRGRRGRRPGRTARGQVRRGPRPGHSTGSCQRRYRRLTSAMRTLMPFGNSLCEQVPSLGHQLAEAG